MGVKYKYPGYIYSKITEISKQRNTKHLEFTHYMGITELIKPVCSPKCIDCVSLLHENNQLLVFLWHNLKCTTSNHGYNYVYFKRFILILNRGIIKWPVTLKLYFTTGGDHKLLFIIRWCTGSWAIMTNSVTDNKDS